MLNWIVWNTTVYILKKMDLALNNQQWLIWHKIKQKQFQYSRNGCMYNGLKT